MDFAGQQLGQTGELLRRPDPFQLLEVGVFAGPVFAVDLFIPNALAQPASGELVGTGAGRHIVVGRFVAAGGVPLGFALDQQITL